MSENTIDLLGKRVIVGIRHIKENGEEEHSGFWGIIAACNRNGFSIQVEGGSNETTEWLPLDLEIFQVAEYNCYQMEDEDVVTDVDYEVYLASAPDVETMNQYNKEKH